MNDDLLKELSRLFDEGAAPGGAVTLLAPENAPVNVSYGTISDGNSAQVTSDTIYDVASVTKLFTTALVLRLHEQKKLSIFDKCSSYLPNFQHSEVRIVDLLTHRFGANISMSGQAAQHPSAEQLRKALLDFEPPTRTSPQIVYGNMEFFYLGVIVEQITSQAIGVVMQELINDLELRQTYIGPDITKQRISTPPTEVVGKKLVQGVTHDESARALGGITGHAGIFSTANDLATFGTAWLTGRIAPQSVVDKLAFKDYDPIGTSPQALGWWLRLKLPDDTTVMTPGVYSHNGFTGSFLAICPRTGKVAALTCNRTYYGRQNARQRPIWKLLTDWISS